MQRKHADLSAISKRMCSNNITVPAIIACTTDHYDMFGPMPGLCEQVPYGLASTLHQLKARNRLFSYRKTIQSPGLGSPIQATIQCR